MTALDQCAPCRAGTQPQFVSQDKKGCKHIGKNSGSYVRQYRVDGEVFPAGSGPERCDFLLLNDTKRTAYYIELKGSDIPKAIHQIDHSVEMLQASHPNYTVYRRIIFRTSRSHEVNSSEVTRWKMKHGTKYIAIKSRELEEPI